MKCTPRVVYKRANILAPIEPADGASGVHAVHEYVVWSTLTLCQLFSVEVEYGSTVIEVIPDLCGENRESVSRSRRRLGGGFAPFVEIRAKLCDVSVAGAIKEITWSGCGVYTSMNASLNESKPDHMDLVGHVCWRIVGRGPRRV